MNPERHRIRRARVCERLEQEHLDAFLVAHLPNIRYLTGFTGSAGTVAITREGCALLTDFRYREQVETEVDRSVHVEIVQGDLVTKVLERLDSSGCRRIGFEDHVVSARDAARYDDRKGHREFVGCTDWIERLRWSKDGDEVKVLRAAARLAGEALEAVIHRVAVGMREIDIAADLESELRRRGSEWHPFETIVASGPRSALPHARTSERTIARGDWLLVDFGARVEGYCADITRTFVVGRPADDRQRAMYELTRDAHSRALGLMKAGMTGKEADDLARRVIESRGFGDAFGHSLGHGLGLEVHEGPRVSTSNEVPMPVGSVVTIEPGVYFPGWGGVRIEDDVHLTDEGADLLSDGRTELREII